mmetsp:Transcript_32525/g.85920  ORF Transcript_32525/g.85920 Transcript_32525/m.85920 type:complete len:299 (+) Transcript_32525:867-1763(+)
MLVRAADALELAAPVLLLGGPRPVPVLPVVQAVVRQLLAPSVFVAAAPRLLGNGPSVDPVEVAGVAVELAAAPLSLAAPSLLLDGPICLPLLVPRDAVERGGRRGGRAPKLLVRAAPLPLVGGPRDLEGGQPEVAVEEPRDAAQALGLAARPLLGVRPALPPVREPLLAIEGARGDGAFAAELARLLAAPPLLDGGPPVVPVAGAGLAIEATGRALLLAAPRDPLRGPDLLDLVQGRGAGLAVELDQCGHYSGRRGRADGLTSRHRQEREGAGCPHGRHGVPGPEYLCRGGWSLAACT